jgi:hypothetical protein
MLVPSAVAVRLFQSPQYRYPSVWGLSKHRSVIERQRRCPPVKGAGARIVMAAQAERFTRGRRGGTIKKRSARVGVLQMDRTCRVKRHLMADETLVRCRIVQPGDMMGGNGRICRKIPSNTQDLAP